MNDFEIKQVEYYKTIDFSYLYFVKTRTYLQYIYLLVL